MTSQRDEKKMFKNKQRQKTKGTKGGEERQRVHIAKLGARTSSDLRDLVYRCESAILCALDEGEDRLSREVPSHD